VTGKASLTPVAGWRRTPLGTEVFTTPLSLSRPSASASWSLQVRTIFEEGWSEIDHKVRYPRQSNDPELGFLLAIFNRLAGSADEMGTFTKILAANLREQATKAKQSARQIQEKEAELKRTISQLQITKEEKLRLQKQIAEINTPPQSVSVNVNALSGLGGSDILGDPYNRSASIYNPLASVISGFAQTCRFCGKPLPPGTILSNPFAPCQDCASKVRGPFGT